VYLDEKGEEVAIPASTPVSMNMWGFTPDYFDYSVDYFREFLAENGQKLKSEFYIPLAVNNLIVQNRYDHNAREIHIKANIRAPN
jgi:hypothetical protein